MVQRRQPKEAANRPIRTAPQRTAAAAAHLAWNKADLPEPDLIFEPECNPCEAAVIWLHGLDDRPEHWASSLTAARKRRPHLKWVFMRAPERRIACYAGKVHPSWGDFSDPGMVAVGSVDHECRDSRGWYAASVAAVHAHIHALEKTGIPSERVVVVGISQGAALAAEAALTIQARLGGWAMLSGWLMPRARAALLLSLNGRGARVLVCHGTEDDQVAYGCALFARDLLKGVGARIEFESFEGG